MAYNPACLPVEIESVVDNFVSTNDIYTETALQGYDMSPLEAARLRGIWSMSSHCPESVLLCNDLRSAGLSATNIFNENAFEYSSNLAGGIVTIDTRVTHLITKVEIDDREVFIDPYWQQFLAYSGVTIEDVEDNPGCIIMPSERVFCYESQHIDDVADYYALVVRTLQEKVRRGVLRGRVASFTRELSLAAMMSGAPQVDSVDYHNLSASRAVAKQIWSPEHYRTLSDSELAELTS